MGLRDKIGLMVVFALATLAMCFLLPLVLLVFAVALVCREPRVPVGLAVALLVIATIALAAGVEEAAEGLAVWAYCFLAGGVILMLARRMADVRQERDVGED